MSFPFRLPKDAAQYITPHAGGCRSFRDNDGNCDAPEEAILVLKRAVETEADLREVR